MSEQFSFIKAGEEFCTLEKYVPAPLFRKKFHVKPDIKSAVLKITGLGYYELHLNGKDITKGYMAPYRSNPQHFIYYDEYDVINALSSGENVIAVILGNGMQNPLGAYIWHFETAEWRSPPKLGFELKIKYANGFIETIISDSNTKTAPSPIIFDDVHYGEYYDARLEIPDWDKIEFDDSTWETALPTDSPGGKLRLCEAEPIVKQAELPVLSITKSGSGYIYDFGTNNAGLCRLCIKNATPGQKILLQHFEMLVDGKPYFNNIRFNLNGIIDRYQEDIYYCSGNGTETHIPRFTYHGFRYVYVTGIEPHQAVPDLLTYIIISSDLEMSGSFFCDNEIINKLQEATVRSDLSNFHYFPTDCPQREKNGWTADAALSAEQMMLNLNPENSFREWLRNIYKAMNEKGQLPGIIPTTGWGYEWGNGPAWDSVIVYLPYYTYIYRGNIEILEDLSDTLFRYLHYIDSRLDENGLIAIGLGDWCEIGTRNGEPPTTPLIVTDSIISADIAEKAAFIYSVLKQTEKKAYAKLLAEKITFAVRKHLIDTDTALVKCSTQTGQSMAIYYGMFTDAERPAAIKQLVRLINEKDDHLAAGVLGNRAIFRALADNGYAELAFKMISRTDYPSFGNWITMGATSLWESFYLTDGHPTFSLNHHFWGDISAWFYIYLAGIKINPSGNDLHEINIAPCFIEKLNKVRASHKLPYGEVIVHWTRFEQIITLSVSVPDNAHGSIVLPDKYVFTDGDNIKPLHQGQYKIIR